MQRDGWRTVVCCASGPSFSVEQAEMITEAWHADRCRVIVVNDNWRRVPTADLCYAADFAWWQVHIAAVRAGFRGELWTQVEQALVRNGAQHAERFHKLAALGLSFVNIKAGNALLPPGDTRISNGSNSGFQAIMLARLFGARRIVLVGYDMQRAGGKKNGALHWFGDHLGTLENSDPWHFAKHFNAVAPDLRAEGTDVVNCSIATALTCFRRAELATTLVEDSCNP